MPPALGYKKRFDGWEMAVYRLNGWVYDIPINHNQPYTLCPDCIKRDFDRFFRSKQ
jgi:hypothetical protein